MFQTEKFTDPQAAVERVCAIYEHNTALLRDAFKRFSNGEVLPGRVRACYPFVRITTEINTRADTRQSFGFVAGPGVYQTTLTRPALYTQYLVSQFKLLRDNHDVPLEIGVSELPIQILSYACYGVCLLLCSPSRNIGALSLGLSLSCCDRRPLS